MISPSVKFIIIVIIIIIISIIYFKKIKNNVPTLQDITTSDPTTAIKPIVEKVIPPSLEQFGILKKIKKSTSDVFSPPPKPKDPVPVPAPAPLPVEVPAPILPKKIDTPPDTEFPYINTISINQFDQTKIINSSIQISNIVIIDQNNNIVLPTTIYNITAGDLLYDKDNNVYNALSSSYIVLIPPTNIKNITITGNNLSPYALSLSCNSGPDGIGTITKLTDEAVQSYNYNLPTLDPNNPLVCNVTIYSTLATPLEVSSVIITDNNGNIIPPTKIDTASDTYTVNIQPSQIKNIKVTGNNLNLVQLIVTNCTLAGFPKYGTAKSIVLTKSPVQNYIYYNNQLTLDITQEPVVVPIVVSQPVSVLPETPIKINMPPDTQFPFINSIHISQQNLQDNVPNIEISNIIITDQNNNIIVPLAIYNIKIDESYYIDVKKKSGTTTELITAKQPFYRVTINPTNIKNITIYGNNLKPYIMALACNNIMSGIGAVTQLTDEPVQSYNYNLPSIDPNNPIVRYVGIYNNNFNGKVDISSIIIKDNNGNIITPVKIDTTSSSYSVEIKPSQIKNITVTGNNLNLIPLTVSNSTITGWPTNSVSTPLTNASVQNYIYFNKKLTLDSTVVSEGFNNNNKNNNNPPVNKVIINTFGSNPIPSDLSVIIKDTAGKIINPTSIQKSGNMFVVNIQPSDIKNITVNGNNLIFTKLILNFPPRKNGRTIDSVYTTLRNTPVQNYNYSDNQLTFVSTSEGFNNIHRTMTLLDTFYLPLHR